MRGAKSMLLGVVFARANRVGVGLLIGAVAAVAVVASAQGPSQAHQLQEAIHTMETKGDCPAAIRVFEAIARGPERTLAGRALLYLGFCYEKLGKDEAQKAYERLVRDFADQHDLVAEARARLSTLRQRLNSEQSTAPTLRRLWTGPEVNTSGAPSPDGRYLSYGNGETGDLAVRDLATGERRRLTNNPSGMGEFVDSSVFSPDGKQVAYTWVFSSNSFYELRIIGVDGSNPRVLYSNRELRYIHASAWSRDGKHILGLFVRGDHTHQIVLVSVADGSARVLKTLDWPGPLNMSLSPDGLYVVYDFPQKEGAPDRDIFLLAVDGSHARPLIEHPANDFVLDFTPDGRKVLFASDRMGTMGVWAIHVANREPQGAP